MPDASADVSLLVHGRRYNGWRSVRITRSIESLSGSFALDVSDRWAAQDKPWPIREEDPCRVEIAGTTVISGYVDKRNQAASADSRTLTYTGRDRAGALVDCSAVMERWTHYNVNVAEFAAKIAAPFGVRVSVQAGLQLEKVRKVVINPGDTAYEAMRRATSDAEVLIVSDGSGGIVITRHGSGRAESIVEGRDILTCSLEYDGTDRYHRYVIVTQVGGTDEAYGDATRVRAEAIDEGVQRKDRVLLMRPDKGYSVADARKRADWEARIRAARAETAVVSVRGWRQPGGQVWSPNALVYLKAPSSIGVDGDMLISQVEHSLGAGGQVTQLRLVRPDAFAPEPKARVGPSGQWKELSRGAL